MRNFIVGMTRNPISLLGAAITTASALLVVALLVLESMGHRGGPYLGIIAFLILPAIFVLGLILIPVGIIRDRRRGRRAAETGTPARSFPVIDLNLGDTRQRIMLFVLLTVVNVVLLASATYKGVEVMDSTSFCGAACHSVMSPEYTAYARSPHARVKCVSCHIGPGAGWFVKSKLSGSWQVVSVAFDLYPRPIPTPVHALRPARETCEQCHWPTKFVGDRLMVNTHYDNDEGNTELKSVLVLRIGGVEGRKSHGIHWHVDPGIQVRYRSDESRETIYDVELIEEDGTVKRFVAPHAPEDESTVGEWRVMDCIDCHNRPSHVYQMPEDEVDRAIREGEIDRSLPYVRREAVRLLQDEYDSHEAAREGITAGLRAFYDDNHSEIAASQAALIEAAAQSTGDIFAYNVFPSMGVTWGTYPNHIGHTRFDGCFRCHDDLHETADGEVISQDCDTCHTLLAMEEEEPEILDQLKP
jgi:nitrate/TMAO reductase-like tetraheme cytochrome c subunit